ALAATPIKYSYVASFHEAPHDSRSAGDGVPPSDPPGTPPSAQMLRGCLSITPLLVRRQEKESATVHGRHPLPQPPAPPARPRDRRCDRQSRSLIQFG